jgi:hypothetical protein
LVIFRFGGVIFVVILSSREAHLDALIGPPMRLCQLSGLGSPVPNRHPALGKSLG